MEWQPIETAPKDGTRIITYSDGLVGTGRYCEKFAQFYGHEIAPGWYSEQLDRRFDPDVWMPLPPPPVSP